MCYNWKSEMSLPQTSRRVKFWGAALRLGRQIYPQHSPDMRKPSVLNGEAVFTHNVQTPPRHAWKKNLLVQ